MASNKTTATTILSGVGFMHSAFRDVDTALWSEESSFAESAATPGTAELQTSMANFSLDVMGSQSAGGVLNVQCQNGGLANGSLGIIMKASADVRYMGWDPPHVMSGFEPVDWTDGTGAGDYTVLTEVPHVQQLQKNHRLGVVYHRRSSLASNNYQVRFAYRTTDSATWTKVTIYQQTGSPPNSQLFHPCLFEMPSGELLVWHWIFNTDADTAQIKQWISRDQGLSWSTTSRACLPEDIDNDSSTGFDVGRIRVGYYNDDVMMVVHLQDNGETGTLKDNFQQYASVNLGTSFDLIDTASTIYTDNENGRYQDIIVDFGFVFLFVATHGAVARRITIAHAYSKLFDVTSAEVTSGTGSQWGDIASGYLGAGELAAWVDTDGRYYVIGRNFQGTTFNNRNFILRSFDRGLNWRNMSTSPLQIGTDPAGMWFNSGATGTLLKNLTAAPFAGTVAVISNNQSSVSTFDDSLTVAWLGGWNTETMPGIEMFPRADKRVGFTDNYIPIELPANVGWTRAVAGTPTDVILNGELVLTSTGAETIDYTRTVTTTVAQGFNPLRVHVAVDTGAFTLGSEVIFMRLRLPAIDISIRFNTTGFRVYDNGSSAQIGSDVSISDMSIGVEIIFGLSSAGFALSYRVQGSPIDQVFLAGPETTSIGTSASGISDLVWGHAASAAATSRWRFIGYTSGAYVGLGKSTRIDSPEDLFWRTLGPGRTYLKDGAQVRDAGSVGMTGDTVHITAGSDYSIRNIWPRVALSLRAGFRTVNTSSEIKIAYRFRVDQLAAANTNPVHNVGRDALFVGIEGANWRTGYVEGYDPTASGGSWVTLHTIDAAEGLSGLQWKRRGDTVEPSESTVHAGTPPYILANEFEGATFEFSSGILRLIKSHTAGLFKGGLTTSIPSGQSEERPVLLMDNIDNAEGNGGLGGRIWSPSLAVIVSLRGTHYTGFRLRIPAQDTATGDFRIAKLIIGGLHVFGMRPDWGRRSETGASVERIESEDGRVYSRVTAPISNIIELPFTAGMHTKQVDQLAPDPDFFKIDNNAAANAITSIKATPYQLQSLMSQLHTEGFPPEPVFILPRIPVLTSGSSTLLNRRFDLMYGEASTRIRLEQVQGEERAGITGKSGEVFRVPLLSVRRLR